MTNEEAKALSEKNMNLICAYLKKTTDDLNTEFDLGYYNDICIGYALIALKKAGADSQLIKNVAESFDCVFDEKTAAEARAAYTTFLES